MRYFGSKFSTVESIHNLISERIPSGTFCDPFGGMGVVGSYFKSKGYTVWSGDILTFAYYFQIARVETNKEPSFRKICEELNLKSAIEVVGFLNTNYLSDGWFVEEYSEKRGFFTRRNAQAIEACSYYINEWSK